MLKTLALFSVASALVCPMDQLPAVANGAISCTEPQTHAGAPPCSLTCSANYKVKTATANKCSTAGAWEGAVGECEPATAECPAVPTVANGTLTCTDAQKTAGATDVCTLTCAANYKVKTATANKCDVNGAWMGAKGECESSYSAALSGVAAILVAALVCQ